MSPGFGAYQSVALRSQVAGLKTAGSISLPGVPCSRRTGADVASRAAGEA
ncbi:MAG: hypothetical protein ACREBE_02400 [bacterium]